MADTTAEPEAILCPLCEYDLRALEEPRCPECGYRFDWDELRDPQCRAHPYLFEHHPERNVRSFFRTLMGGWRPRRFWATFYPTQPSRPRRLAVYFLIVCVSGLVHRTDRFIRSSVLSRGRCWPIGCSRRCGCTSASICRR